MLQLPSVSFSPIPEALLPTESAIASLPRAKKRIIQLLAKGSPTNPQEARKSWSLDFLLSPHSLHWSEDALSHVTFTQNQLNKSDPFSPSASVTPLPESQVDIPASVCFRSIGYKSLPLPGLEELGVQFDSRQGIIPNDGVGRIIQPFPPDQAQDSALENVSTLPGLYCAGWVKRGPTGVIASTMTDAFATADAIAADWAEHISSAGKRPFLNVAEGGSTGRGLEEVLPEARNRGLRPTNWQDWEQIDQAEREKGEGRGKVREKFGTIEEMMEVIS